MRWPSPRVDQPPVTLDRDRLLRTLEGLQAHDLEAMVEALKAKHALFSSALQPGALEGMEEGTWKVVLDSMFPARRRLAPRFAELPEGALFGAISGLLYGSSPLEARMEAFRDLLPEAGRKERGALWDMASDLLHFTAPERHPLMARWVWDARTRSGALLRFMEGDALEGTPEVFEKVRRWMAGQLREEGFYRDTLWVVDLILAQAYADYAQGVTSKLGMSLTQESPTAFMEALLGIDRRRSMH
ncbi:MAG: hypothetical protein D6819_07500 [Gammaproteobacteria bacterium]|nr:MAG: hypothetical protein D6819_07500 [Gammaproteobacteria bacterium]